MTFAYDEMSGREFDYFVSEYIESTIWSGTWHDIESDLADGGLESYLWDVDDEMERAMRADCRAFLESITLGDYREYLESHTVESMAHDFSLTRQHHGAGFWDRGLGDLGDRLTRIAEDHGGEGIHAWVRFPNPGDLSHAEVIDYEYI